MFVPRETQERLTQLEAENKSLRKQLGEEVNNRPNTIRLKLFLILGWVFFMAAAIVAYLQYQKASNATGVVPQILTEEGLSDWVAPVDSGIVFRVQIGAFEDFSLEPFKAQLEEIYSVRNDTLERIGLGSFEEFSKAQEFLDYVYELGFEDAYITATLDGKAIGLMQAIRTQAPSNGASE